MLLASIGMLRAEGKIITFDLSKGYANEEAITTVTMDDVTLLFDKGEGENIPAWFTTGTAARMYSKNTLKISTSNSENITGVIFNFSTKSNNFHRSTGKVITVTPGEYKEENEIGIWTVEGKELNLTAVDAKGHARIQSIKVMIGEIEEEPTPTEAPMFSIAEGIYTETQKVALSTKTEGASIYYTLNGTTPTVASELYSEPIEIEETTTIKAIAVKEEVISEEVSATYTIERIVIEEGTVVFDLTNEIASVNNVITLSGDDATILIAKAAGSTTPVWNKTGSAVRVYAKNTLSFKSNNNKIISSVKFIYSDASCNLNRNYDKKVTVSDGEYFENGAQGEWNGLTNEFVITATDQTGSHARIQKIIVKLEDKEISAVSSPVFNLENGTYYGSQTIEITCETPDAEIYYTTDGEDATPESPKYTGSFEITETTIVKAIAVVGEEVSELVWANYIIAPSLVSLESWNGFEKGQAVEISTPLAVAYHNGRYLYMTDNGTDYVLVYDSSEALDRYENGDILPAGIRGTKDIYYSLHELLPVVESFGEVTKGASVEPTVRTLSSITAEDQNKYVQINNVTFDTTDKNIIDGDDKLAYYDRFKIEFPEAGKTYNVKGFASVSNDKVQLFPTVFEFVNSVESTDINVVSINVINGAIEVNGASEIEIYTIGGSVISKGAAKVACPVGMYIVKADGKAYKVIVK